MDVLTIGQLAEAAGVHVETVRYYERRELLAPPPRSAAGYRQYAPADVWRLKFIARAKRLGFTLAEIRELVGADDECSAQRTLAAATTKLAAIEQEAQELAAIRSRLEQLIDVCAGGADADCANLDVS
jgi:MerR family copper efflux transcriptional regulator